MYPQFFIFLGLIYNTDFLTIRKNSGIRVVVLRAGSFEAVGAGSQAGLHISGAFSLEFAAMHHCLPPESVDIEEP